MLNRSLRIRGGLAVLFVAALVFAGPANFAKDSPAQLNGSEDTPDGGRAASPAGEKILIATGGRIILIDRTSKTTVWESNGLHGALSVSALPNGEFLVGEGKSIARVDSVGKTVSRAAASFKMTTDVKPLENGRMLVCDGPAGTVAEMDWSGKTTWSVSNLHHPSEAVRLANGNTLVADGTAELKEFDPNGKLVRGTWLKQWAAAVQRLPDGNTLVGERESIEFLDSSGHAIWSVPIYGRATGVQQLPSGEYLVSEPDAKRVVIMEVSGSVTWEATGLNYPWRAIYVQ
jgi:hypothetical protein